MQRHLAWMKKVSCPPPDTSAPCTLWLGAVLHAPALINRPLGNVLLGLQADSLRSRLQPQSTVIQQNRPYVSQLPMPAGKALLATTLQTMAGPGATEGVVQAQTIANLAAQHIQLQQQLAEVQQTTAALKVAAQLEQRVADFDAHMAAGKMLFKRLCGSAALAGGSPQASVKCLGRQRSRLMWH